MKTRTVWTWLISWRQPRHMHGDGSTFQQMRKLFPVQDTRRIRWTEADARWRADRCPQTRKP